MGTLTLVFSQAAAWPQVVEQDRATTGSNEPVNGHVEANSSAFVLVSGLCLDALIIRRSEVRVLPAPLFAQVRGYFRQDAPPAATGVLPNVPGRVGLPAPGTLPA
jgi:hypothetical protein